jgi:hypothetical protein
VTVTGDPVGQQGKVYQETVCAVCNNSTGASAGDWVYLFNEPTSYFGHNGQENWMHFRVMFPGGGAYHNTLGEWNTLMETHTDNNVQGCEDAELFLNVVQYVDDPYPYLGFRALGGPDTCPLNDGSGVWTYDSSNPLQYNHWYDMLFHVIWSPSSQTGLIEWWKDGTLMVSKHTATLWQRPDGSTDVTDFELNNYRLHATWNSTVYYSKTAIGSTAASVGF